MSSSAATLSAAQIQRSLIILLDLLCYRSVTRLCSRIVCEYHPCDSIILLSSVISLSNTMTDYESLSSGSHDADIRDSAPGSPPPHYPDTPSISVVNPTQYASCKQVRAVAKRRALGPLITVFLVFLIFATIRIWREKGVMPPSQKSLFNFLSIVFSIALGLNFSVGLGTPHETF